MTAPTHFVLTLSRQKEFRDVSDTKDLVNYHTHDGVAVITMNEPNRRNPLSDSMSHALTTAIHRAEEDTGVRAVVLTGAGSSFSSGADRSDPSTHSSTDLRSYQEGLGTAIYDVIGRSPLPVIAAINGPAVGAGANLAISCDLRVAATSSWMSFAQVSVGVMPANGNLVRLTRIVGISDALELTLTSRRIGADEAGRLRLVNRVVASSDVLPRALDLARQIADQAPLAVRLTKEAAYRGLDTTLDNAINADRYRMFILYQTLDRKEADQAWHAGRKPEFVGE